MIAGLNNPLPARDKESLRKLYKEKRKGLGQQDISDMSSAIAGLFFQHFEPVEVTHVFIPIIKFNEVDTNHIIKGLQHNDLVTCTSVSDFSTQSMQTIAFTSETEFILSDFGIPEPIGGPQLDPRDVDRVIMPLLAYDETGNRIGYGKGFYDRFLSDCNPDVEKVGVSFFPPELQIPEISDHDIRIDACITPDHVFRFK